MTDPRPIEQWAKVLGDLPAPNGVNAEQLMAARVLADLAGYRPKGPNKDAVHFRDRQELANAMVAYGRMMFDAGVRP